MKTKILFFFIISTLLVLSHSTFVWAVNPEKLYCFFRIYFFFWPLSFIVFLFCLWVHFKYPNRTAYAYAASSFSKMMLAGFFLYLLLESHCPKKFTLFHCIFSYFGLLFVEVLILLKVLRGKKE